jgi:hypothetical protein
MVGVDVAARVGDALGVTVQPGGMAGMFGSMEQPAMERASQSPRMKRIFEAEVVVGLVYFILFL